MVFLLVVCQEKERLVPHQGTAERAPELMLGKVRSEAGGGSTGEAVAEVVGELIVLAEVVPGAVELIGAGLGDDVDEAATRTAELGVGAVGDHYKVLHRVQIEG